VTSLEHPWVKESVRINRVSRELRELLAAEPAGSLLQVSTVLQLTIIHVLVRSVSWKEWCSCRS